VIFFTQSLVDYFLIKKAVILALSRSQSGKELQFSPYSITLIFEFLEKISGINPKPCSVYRFVKLIS